MQLKKPVIFFLLFLYSQASIAQGHGSETIATGPKLVKWMTFEQAIEKSKTEKRKIFIDVYTEWCGWCKVMDAKTFTDPKIAKLMNDYFYCVKLDAEQKGDIKFANQTFKYIENGGRGVHQLAAALLNNQMSYPNFIFLDEEYKIVPIYEGSNSVPGFHKPEDFHVFLSFVSGNLYKKQNTVIF